MAEFATRLVRASTLVLLCGALSACGGGLFGGGGGDSVQYLEENRERALQQRLSAGLEGQEHESIFDLFLNTDDPNTTVEVNRYIWNASLEILDFMPIEGADPFSGVIVMGYGTPPGGGRAYRATVYVQDPALDARSLNVALQTRSGPADRDTVRAIEDAILTRARQLRIRDGRL